MRSQHGLQQESEGIVGWKCRGKGVRCVNGAAFGNPYQLAVRTGRWQVWHCCTNGIQRMQLHFPQSFSSSTCEKNSQHYAHSNLEDAHVFIGKITPVTDALHALGGDPSVMRKLKSKKLEMRFLCQLFHEILWQRATCCYDPASLSLGFQVAKVVASNSRGPGAMVLRSTAGYSSHESDAFDSPWPSGCRSQQNGT